MKPLNCLMKLTLGLTLTVSLSGLSAAEKPNIIFILTDDQGYGDLGRHGHPLLKTPHTDRLYDESVRFDNFYVSPACSPTRAALLTGMHEFRNGVTHTREPREHLYKEAVLLPQLLKTAGYATAFIGKWHLSSRGEYAPQHRGFDWCSTNPQGPRKHFDPEIIRNNERTQRKGYREDIFFDEAMAFIEESGNKPFFCYLATYSPHDPLDAPEEFIAPFRDHVSEKQAKYLGMVANLDYNVGRLLEFLEQQKLDQNTIVIFMNDNGQTWGLDVYNAGMRGCKCTIWEGGSRAISFWRWPRRWQPHKVDNLTAHLDVLPTLCELAGVKVSEQLQSKLEGFSLVPLLDSQEAVPWHDNRMLFQHVGRWPSGMAAAHKYAMCGVRQGNYLLLRSRPCDEAKCTTAVLGNQCATLRAVEKGQRAAIYTKENAQFHWGVSPADRWVLFDTKADPACQKDLAAANPQRVAAIAKAYDQWWDGIYPVMIERGGDAELTSLKEKRRAAAPQQPAAKAAAVSPPATPAETPAGVSERGAAMFRRMDANADRRVTKEEFVGLFMGTFARKDTNKDGKLTADEFPHPGALKSGDADRDGSLTRKEFQVIYEKQFIGRDRNGDGVVTADEL